MATLFKVGHASGLEVEVKDDLDVLQELVSGPIQFVYFKDGSAMMVNEEGLLRRMPLNGTASAVAALKGHVEPLVGPCVFLSKTEMEALS